MSGFRLDLDRFESDGGRLRDFGSRIRARSPQLQRSEWPERLHRQDRDLSPTRTSETGVPRRYRSALNAEWSPASPLNAIQQLVQITFAVQRVTAIPTLAY